MQTDQTANQNRYHLHHLFRFRGTLIAFLLIIAAWLWLYRPVLIHIADVFTRPAFRLNQILLIGIVGLALHKAWPQLSYADSADSTRNFRGSGDKSRSFFESFNLQLSWPALLLMTLSTLGYLAAERWIDINTISAVFFGIGTYGLIGLWLSSARWWRGLPIALLMIGTLPFNAHLETFVGYPLRIATAEIVGRGLARLGFPSIGTETILIFENGISQIDIPCSGVKSLWSGTLFYLTAIWLEGKRLSLVRLAEFLLLILLLIAANLVRVTILVLIGEALGWHLFAEMLHLPLGVLGFAAVCAVMLGVLRLQSTKLSSSSVVTISPTGQTGSQPLTAWIVLSFIILCGFLYAERQETAAAQPLSDWRFPESWHVTQDPLDVEFKRWLEADGAERIERIRFEKGEISGAMILISAHSWRAHHRPENCFTVYGLEINDTRTHLLGENMPIRDVKLGNPSTGTAYQAAYWYQSADRLTDDHSGRVWADALDSSQRWVMVSIIFDDAVTLNDVETNLFLLEMQTELDKWLIQNS